MDILDKRLKEVSRTLENIKSYPLQELILSIEAIYQANKELVSFSYEKSEEFKNHPIDPQGFDANRLYKYFKFYATDEDGIRDVSIEKNRFLNKIGIHNAYAYTEMREDVVVLNNFLENFDKYFNGFNLINEREQRFDVYEKIAHGVIPDYKKWINQMRDGELNLLDNNTRQIVNENGNLIAYKKDLYPDDLNVILFNLISEKNRLFVLSSLVMGIKEATLLDPENKLEEVINISVKSKNQTNMGDGNMLVDLELEYSKRIPEKCEDVGIMIHGTKRLVLDTYKLKVKKDEMIHTDLMLGNYEFYKIKSKTTLTDYIDLMKFAGMDVEELKMYNSQYEKELISKGFTENTEKDNKIKNRL